MADHNLLALGTRLAQARARAGYERATDFVQALKARNANGRVYFSHEAGERHPTDEALTVYAEMLGVSKEFLLSGDANNQQVQR